MITDLKLCINCKHFLKHSRRPAPGQEPVPTLCSTCYHPKNLGVNLVDGTHAYFFSPEKLRGLGSMCGEKGMWFEPKEQTK